MSWLILHIHHQADFVSRCLARDGHESFNPTYIVESVVRGQKQPVRRNLYQGYLFLAYSDRWVSAAHCDGVSAILKASEDSPHVVSDEIVDGLRVNPNMPVHESRPFRKRDIVRVKSGKLVGYFGSYRWSKGESSVVRLTFRIPGSTLPAERDVTLPTHTLEATPRAP